MYFRLSALLPIAALAAVTAAAPGELEARAGAGAGGGASANPGTTATTATTTTTAAATTTTTTTQCNTGTQECCSTTYDQTATSIASLGLVGLVLPQVGALIGLGCTPITVVGTGAGSTCTQQPVCCTNTAQNGLVNIGCTPIAATV